MKKATLEQAFKEALDSTGRSYRDIGGRCDLNPSTVSKVATGQPVRWETLHLILTVGMSIPKGSATYENLYHLWLSMRQEIAESRPAGHAKRKAGPAESAAVQRFRKIIAGKSAAAIDRALEAAAEAVTGRSAPAKA